MTAKEIIQLCSKLPPDTVFVTFCPKFSSYQENGLEIVAVEKGNLGYFSEEFPSVKIGDKFIRPTSGPL